MKTNVSCLPRLSLLSGMLLSSLYLPAYAGDLAHIDDGITSLDDAQAAKLGAVNINTPSVINVVAINSEPNHQQVTGLENISLGELLTNQTDSQAQSISDKQTDVQSNIHSETSIGELLAKESVALESTQEDSLDGVSIGELLTNAESASLDEQEFEFNDSFFGSGDLAVDVTRFAKGNYVSPGKYYSEVKVNGEYRGYTEVEFIERNNHSVVCMSPKIREMLDVKPEAFDMAVVDSEACPVLKSAVPSATINFDAGNQSLDINIPQALTITRPRGYIPPSRWQDGVPAAFINYSASFSQSHDKYNPTSKGGYVYVHGGMNFRGWALRHRGSQSWTNGKTDGYQAGETHLQKTIEPLRSKLTIGDINTEGHIVDSVSLRGVMMETDNRMLPQSLRGYAPRIEGVANTSNARVVVKQNGGVIYETSVSAGPFVINDLYATGYSGELEVEIYESSGEIRRFKVPFASLISLLRPGQFKYQVAVGNHRDGRSVSNDRVLSGFVQYGYSNNLTLNAGLLGNKHYFATSAGIAYNSKFGAFSGDVTRTYAEFVNSKDKDRIQNGYSVRASYNYNIVQTNTNIMLATYRYFSHNYYSLAETLRANNSEFVDGTNIRFLGNRPKNQYRVSISQSLGGHRGNLYVSGVARKYWGVEGTAYDYQIAYANTYKKMGYQFSYSKVHPIGPIKGDEQFFVSVSLPLFKDRPNRSAGQFGATAIKTGNRMGYQSNYSQVLGEQRRYSYSVSHSAYDDLRNNKSEATSISAAYRGDIVNLNGSMSRNNLGSTNISMGMEGAIVAHPKGVTLSNRVGDTFAIVHSKHGAGAILNNGMGRKLDRFGNAIVEHATPYELNYVSIDPSMLPMNVQFDATEKEVVPKAGTAIMVELNGRRSSMVMFNVESDFDIPMGIEAVDDKGNAVGYVAQGGALFADKLEETKGRIHIKWGNAESERCYFDYNIPSLNNADVNDISQHDVRCIRESYHAKKYR